MSRNKNRTGAKMPDSTPPPNLTQTQDSTGGGFSFVVPTEFVDLPSQGQFYPEGHPLRGQDSIEIKQMTAKEEDLLTSRTLLKKGVALDRLIQSLIIDKSIDAEALLTGDRNAILIACRVSAYGNVYNTQVTCPACGENQKYDFDLNDANIYHGDDTSDVEFTNNGNGTFTTVLPKTQIKAQFKILTGYDEKQFTKLFIDKKTRKDDQLVTNHLRNILVQVNDHTSAEAINYVVENIPSVDARHLRRAYRLATPNVDLTQHFECIVCDHEELLEVPLSADFFWPDR